MERLQCASEPLPGAGSSASAHKATLMDTVGKSSVCNDSRGEAPRPEVLRSRSCSATESASWGTGALSYPRDGLHRSRQVLEVGAVSMPNATPTPASSQVMAFSGRREASR
jgi:hypothetical protein